MQRGLDLLRAGLLRLGLRGLLQHKLRSTLSILGVVFGVAAVVAMSSVGEGARREAVAQTGALGIDSITLRLRPASQTPRRLLLLIHGWTGDENSMWVFARNLPSDDWIIAPRAPHAAETFGYSWRSRHGDAEGRPTVEDLHPSADALIGLVQAYSTANGIDAGSLTQSVSVRAPRW